MLSINQIIMREIHNEQSDLTTSATGREVFDQLQKETDLDDVTQRLLWRSRQQARTFFGSWLNEGVMDDDDEDDNTELSEVKNNFYQAMLLSSLEFETSTDPYPHDRLVMMLQQTLLDGHHMGEDEVYHFLAGLIECETIAPWLLVCPVNGYGYEDMGFGD